MLIIGIGLIILGIIFWKLSDKSYKHEESLGAVAVLSLVPGVVLTLIMIIMTCVTYFETYPEMEMFYTVNAPNYKTVVDKQNEVATLNLGNAEEGEVFDGSDFSQSRETSSRYQEYRDAVNDYNLTLAGWSRRGGTFWFWPISKPNSELNPIELN